ncbi:MAG: hypothetical protein JNK54_03190 [Elusimicrobia bacterium]|jgi:tetratricopeptide (TPR) repeat protein|nr:hypothetical protein [Elusimicrobiota bacterium]
MKWVFRMGVPAGALVLLLGSAFAGEETPKSYFQEGQAAYDRGEYAAAVNLLTEALIHTPRDRRVSRLLLSAGQKVIDGNKIDRIPAKDLQQIIDQAENVLEERQRDLRRALAELKIAERASHKRTPKETLRACRGVDLMLEVTLGDDPASQKFRDYLHSVCSNLEAALHAGVLLNPSDEKRVMGYVAFCKSDWEEASRSWGEALSLRPDDGPLRDLWVEAQDRFEKDQTEKEIEQGLAKAETAIKEKRDKDALSLLQSAMKAAPGDKRLILLFEKTQERVSREAREKLVLFHREKALKAQRAGQWISAAQGWLAVLQEDPLDPQARDEIERIRVRVGNRLGRLVETEDPVLAGDAAETAEKLYTLGLIRYAEGDLSGAADRFLACLKVNPGHAYARKALERVHEERRPTP